MHERHAWDVDEVGTWWADTVALCDALPGGSRSHLTAEWQWTLLQSSHTLGGSAVQ